MHVFCVLDHDLALDRLPMTYAWASTSVQKVHFLTFDSKTLHLFSCELITGKSLSSRVFECTFVDFRFKTLTSRRWLPSGACHLLRPIFRFFFSHTRDMDARAYLFVLMPAPHHWSPPRWSRWPRRFRDLVRRDCQGSVADRL